MAELNGAELARQVVAEFQTEDVIIIAARAGVKIRYRRWPLVTVGEYEPRTATITVNTAALERAKAEETELSALSLERLIIAHELGHFFDAQTSRTATSKHDAEHIAHGFAAALLHLDGKLEQYEKLWRE